jgi:alkylhydroperoxidase family enzyme
MQVKTVVLAPESTQSLASAAFVVIQLYHHMDSLVIRLWRSLTRQHSPHTAPAPPASARVLPAYAALGRYQLHRAELDPRLRLLVTQLAAERSRCRWCIERGRHEWREAQLSLDALRALSHYETSPLFSHRERAALRFTDAVTRYNEAKGGMPLEPLLRARQHLSEPEIAAVTAAAAAQHFFNPITGALGADAAPWGAPIGSPLRNFWL